MGRTRPWRKERAGAAAEERGEVAVGGDARGAHEPGHGGRPARARVAGHGCN